MNISGNARETTPKLSIYCLCFAPKSTDLRPNQKRKQIPWFDNECKFLGLLLSSILSMSKITTINISHASIS